MGGLVIRSACHYARAVWPRGRHLRIGRPWTTRVRRVVLIGVPNTGAPLEVFVNLLSATLWSLPVPATRLVGLGLDHRSAGIKDLRFGAILDDDWQEQDPSAIERTGLHRVRRPRRARYLVIVGSVTADPAHPLAQIIGDAVVTSDSAAGLATDAGERDLLPSATVRLFPNVPHLALANRPVVYAAIDAWWSSRPR